MNQKTTIETILNCRATASLSDQISQDLSQPDKPIESVLQKENEETDESSNDQDGSD